MAESKTSLNGAGDVLFVDKVFLSECPELIRGVELFNLKLIKDMVELGRRVTVVCHESWQNEVAGLHDSSRLLTLTVGGPARPAIGGLVSIPRILKQTAQGAGSGGHRFEYLLLGNVANGLIPALFLYGMLRLYRQAVLIAHREPSVRFVRFLRKDTQVVAVNGRIAGHFTRAGLSAEVDYGVTDAGDFDSISRSERKGTVNFCVLGFLDNAWKGADTALEAFRSLPPEVRKGSCLHLASFEHPPAIEEENVIVYRWMPRSGIPGFLASMDVMIVPSRDEEVMRETFCQAMVQGMLSGLPVIVNRLPILVEKIDQGGGLEFSGIEELTRAMTELWKDRELRERLGREGRQIALERYVWRTDEFLARYFSQQDPGL